MPVSMWWLSTCKPSTLLSRKVQPTRKAVSSTPSVMISKVVVLLMWLLPIALLSSWMSHKRWKVQPHSEPWRTSNRCSCWTTLLHTRPRTTVSMHLMPSMPTASGWWKRFRWRVSPYKTCWATRAIFILTVSCYLKSRHQRCDWRLR